MVVRYKAGLAQASLQQQQDIESANASKKSQAATSSKISKRNQGKNSGGGSGDANRTLGKKATQPPLRRAKSTGNLPKEKPAARHRSHSAGSGRSIASSFVGKRILIYKNGDRYDKGITVSVTKKQFPTWASFLQYLNGRKLLVHAAVNKIYSLHGSLVEGHGDLTEGESYVAATAGFISVDYGQMNHKEWKPNPRVSSVFQPIPRRVRSAEMESIPTSPAKHASASPRPFVAKPVPRAILAARVNGTTTPIFLKGKKNIGRPLPPHYDFTPAERYKMRRRRPPPPPSLAPHHHHHHHEKHRQQKSSSPRRTASPRTHRRSQYRKSSPAKPSRSRHRNSERRRSRSFSPGLRKPTAKPPQRRTRSASPPAHRHQSRIPVHETNHRSGSRRKDHNEQHASRSRDNHKHQQDQMHRHSASPRLRHVKPKEPIQHHHEAIHHQHHQSPQPHQHKANEHNSRYSFRSPGASPIPLHQKSKKRAQSPIAVPAYMQMNRRSSLHDAPARNRHRENSWSPSPPPRPAPNLGHLVNREDDSPPLIVPLPNATPAVIEQTPIQLSQEIRPSRLSQSKLPETAPSPTFRNQTRPPSADLPLRRDVIMSRGASPPVPLQPYNGETNYPSNIAFDENPYSPPLHENFNYPGTPGYALAQNGYASPIRSTAPRQFQQPQSRMTQFQFNQHPSDNRHNENQQYQPQNVAYGEQPYYPAQQRRRSQQALRLPQMSSSNRGFIRSANNNGHYDERYRRTPSEQDEIDAEEEYYRQQNR